nr:retrovirus-related Pol polyprotein from transposon TNT 1-94 [Tanacetum cinerariifolium]
KKGLVTGTNGEEGYLLSVDVEPTSSVEQRNESKVTEAFANFDSFKAFPSYEVKHRLRIHFHVERKLGFLRGVGQKELGKEMANESGSVLVLPSNCFPLTRVKWLPLIANLFAVSGIVIMELRVRAKTWSAAHIGLGNGSTSSELEARYQVKPTKKHLQTVKRIFQYLKGAINIGLWYSKDTDMSLTAYADADHAGSTDSICDISLFFTTSVGIRAREYGMAGDDYEGPLVLDDDQYEKESMPVYDTDIKNVIEEEEGFVGKRGFGVEENNIEDIVVVATNICSSMIQTNLSVDVEEDVNTKSHELMSFEKNIIIKLKELFLVFVESIDSICVISLFFTTSTVIHDIANNLRMDYLPKRKWSNLDRQRSRIMIKVIDKMMFERRLMRNLEKFVGGRDYGTDL